MDTCQVEPRTQSCFVRCLAAEGGGPGKTGLLTVLCFVTGSHPPLVLVDKYFCDMKRPHVIDSPRRCGTDSLRTHESFRAVADGVPPGVTCCDHQVPQPFPKKNSGRFAALGTTIVVWKFDLDTVVMKSLEVAGADQRDR